MVKAIQNTRGMTVSAVDLDVSRSYISGRFLSETPIWDREYKAKVINYPKYIWAVGKIRCNPLDNQPFIRVINQDDNSGTWEDIPVMADTICAYTGYEIIGCKNTAHSGESCYRYKEVSHQHVYEKDLLFVLDRNTSSANLFRVLANAKGQWIGKSLNVDEDGYADWKYLNDLSGLYVEKVGNLIDGINFKQFIDLDLPYINIYTNSDDLAYLLKARYFTICTTKNMEVSLQELLTAYVQNGGALSKESKELINKAVKNTIESDITIAYCDSDLE